VTDKRSCLLELTNIGIAVERRTFFTRTYDEDVTKWIFSSSVIFCAKTTRELLNFVTSLLSEVWRWVSLQSQPGPDGIHEGKVTLCLGTKITWVMLGRITLKHTAFLHVGPPLRWQSTTRGTQFCASKRINCIVQSWLWNKLL